MACCDSKNSCETTSDKKDCKRGCCVTRFFMAALAGFIFVFFFEWLVHGKLLADLYAQTPQLWRTPEAMKETFPLMVLGQILCVVLITLIAWYHKCCGCPRRFIVAISAVFGLHSAMAYIWMPISAQLAGLWFINMFVQTLVVFTIVYAVLSGGKLCWKKCCKCDCKGGTCDCGKDKTVA